MNKLETFIQMVNLYEDLEQPFYTKRLKFWKDQRQYVQNILDKGWEPTPKQLQIVEGNIENLTRVVKSLS